MVVVVATGSCKILEKCYLSGMKIHLVMSLPAMSFGGRIRIGGGGWMHPKGVDSMAVSWLCFRNALIGSGWAAAVFRCTNGLGKPSSHLAQCPFPAGKLFSQSQRVVAG